jgi:hypothetical protein
MAQRVLSAAYKELGIDVAFTPLPIRRGYAQAEAGEVDGLGMTVTLELAPNLEALFRKLALGRTDVVVESRFNGCLVKQLGLQKAGLPLPAQPARSAGPPYHRGAAQDGERRQHQKNPGHRAQGIPGPVRLISATASAQR